MPRWLLVFSMMLAGCAAQRPPASAPPQTSPEARSHDALLPADPNVLQGTLENGLTYYVRRDGVPAGRAYLGLIVKAGQVNESAGQQGFSHLVAHLAFSGTSRFDRDKLAESLHRLGLEPATEQHVVTSADCTIYGLALPGNSEADLAAALDLLGEWSSAVAFGPEQVERERRAVLDEVRRAGDSEKELASQTLDTLLWGSAAAARSSSAVESALGDVRPEQLRGFYHAWYRPERMAVIAVGGFEPKRLEQAIRARFASIEGLGVAPTVPPPSVPLNHETAFAGVPARESDDDDDETEEEPEDAPAPTPTVISIGFKRARSPLRTETDLRAVVTEAVYGRLVETRLNELAQRRNSPVMAPRWRSVSQLPLDLSVVQVVVKPGRLEAAMQAVWAELRRIRLQGFEPKELRAAAQAAKSFPTAGTRLDHERSMAAHFLYGDALLALGVRQELEQKLLGEIGLSEIEDFSRSMFSNADKVVLASGRKAELVPEQTLRAAVARAESDNPGSDPAAESRPTLVDRLPEPGSVTREESNAALGITIWKLSNGATLVIKPTRFEDGEVLFQARAPGGTSLASDQAYWSASLAPRIVSAGGLGRYGPEALGKLLAGHSVEGHPWISETEQGMRVKAAPEDLELMLELVYSGFTAPRKDPEAFDEVKEQWREELEARERDVDAVFADVQRQEAYGNHSRRRFATLKTVDQLRLDAAFDFYQQRFSRASGFTFVLVGDIDPGRLEPLVERYLASLPSPARSARTPLWRDVGARLVGGVKRIQVDRGYGDTSTVMLTFHREAPWSREAATALDALGDYVAGRMREALTAQPRAARSLSVTAEFERRPVAQSTLTITFDCPRAAVAEAKGIVLDTIRDVTASPARPADVARVRDARKRAFEQSLEKNDFWLQALGEAYEFGSEPPDIEQWRSSVDRIDAAMLERTARDDLDVRRYIEAVRSPPNK